MVEEPIKKLKHRLERARKGLSRLEQSIRRKREERLFWNFRREFKRLFPDKVNIHVVLATIPEDVWKKIHRQLVFNFHPDRSGDHEITLWVNKLNEGIKTMRNWT